ncbi:polyketide synthase [Aspergillus heteromorphus CBS 117.55]|uniref:Polyketide synthase n=1 Tax=Aspergillus heteromorphus CBS 117.55 TaxID=1448321 RepID=A0A317W1K6_9EURO|nr:polyketide synthase [Aspergillus heteromorphus CBS 117.55]PWY79152.1 polyketide synthase [Aspergillus heteromorphus CBS 117.55]
MERSPSQDWATEPIAIVGLSCKLAGEASSPQKLWEMLAAGRSGWSEIPEERFNLAGVYHPKRDKLSTTDVRGGHFMDEDLGLFDAPFFNFSAEMATTMDPQFRLQLESVYEALENAGIPLPTITGSNTAVYAALFVRDYRDMMMRDEESLPRFYPTGNGDAMSSNRVSHFFDLRGPSFTLDTGCSGGLVAFHQAVQGLRSGESDMGLVCGANVMLNPDNFKVMASVGLLSPDGKSYAFDSRANGYGRGEGIATLVIKRLSDALAAGDPIRAIIRETGLNQDGKTETITTPSGDAQVAVIQDCYRRAGLNPRDTQYFEAHGTGTLTGDPIEARAIATVFQEGRTESDPLRIGSVKTNIGHTESVSGLASLIKVVLAMEKGMIPPSINFEKPNPKLALEEWRLKVVTELEAWEVPTDGVRRASINNFGYGGTNAHVIVEDTSAALKRIPTGGANGPAPLDSQLLVLSARDESACKQMVANLKEHLQQKQLSEAEESHFLQELIYTLGERRTRFPWIAAQPVPTTTGLAGVIQALSTPKFTPRRTTKAPRIGMVFTGQGAQWHAMGRELIAAYPVFRASLQEGDGYLRALGATYSLVTELARDAASSRINQVELSTPLCIAVQISLVRLLHSWGVRAEAVTSHSSGEIAAAYAVGALTYASAMAVAYHRAVLASDKRLRGPSPGAMIALGVGADESEAYLARLTGSGTAVVACVNSPSSTTVSGDESAVLELEALASADSVFARRLKVETAYHSHHMSPIADPYRDALAGLSSGLSDGDDDDDDSSQIAFSSPVTGNRITILDQLADPDHWVDSLLQPVQFIDAFTDMVLGDGDASSTAVDLILEVGPHTALGGPIKQILSLPEFTGATLPYFGCLVRNTSALASMQSLAASLLAEGYALNLDAVNFPHGRPASLSVLTSLPSYPWNHQTRHWFEGRFNRALRARALPPHNLLGTLVLGTNPESPSWRNILKLADTPWVREHVVQNNILYPGAGFICLAIEAARQQTTLLAPSQTISGFRLRSIDILQALVVPDTAEGIEVQTTLHPVSDRQIGARGWKAFEIASVTLDNHWTVHARGLIITETQATAAPWPLARPAGLTGYTRHVAPSDLYTSLRAVGINHGKIFQGITAIEQSGDNSRADSCLFVPDTAMADDLPHFAVIHPTTLDLVIQTIYAPLLGTQGDDGAKVPRSIGSLWVSAGIEHAPGHGFRAFTSLRHADAQTLRADVVMADEGDGEGAPVLEMRDAVCQSLGRSAGGGDADAAEKEICMKLEWGVDVSLADRETLTGLVSSAAAEEEEEGGKGEGEAVDDLRRLAGWFVGDALASLTSTDVGRLEGHLARVYAWMKTQGASGGARVSMEAGERQALTERVRQGSVDGELLCRVGPHLASILRREIAAADLMNEDGLLGRYRSGKPAGSHPGDRGWGGRGGNHPAGVAGPGHGGDGGPRAEVYHVTAATGALEEIQAELQAWGDVLQVGKLDVQADPMTQGFEPESFDIVLVGPGSSVAGSMENVRSLMKAGGTLLLLESREQAEVVCTLGLLPEWWEGRQAVAWDETLRTTGFSGVQLAVGHETQTILSVAGPVPVRSLASVPLVLVTRLLAPPEARWLASLQARLGVTEVLALETAPVDAYQGKIALFVGEIDRPLLHGLDEAGLDGVRAMAIHSRDLLWVTSGGAVDCERPEMGLAPGFVRTLRHEYIGRKFVTLDLDPTADLWADASVETIARVVTASFGVPQPAPTQASAEELEYAERGGSILVARMYRDGARNRAINPTAVDWASPESIPVEPLFQADRPLALRVGMPGLLDTIAFDDDVDAPDGTRFPPDLIEIEPRAYGVNFRDVMVAMGQLEERVMGLDAAGVITRVGSRAAAHGYAVGDEVFAMLRGGYGSRARTEWQLAMHLPPNLDFAQAASVPVLFITVYLAFYQVARLERGQTVLIHAAAGGVGQVAIQFAQLIGAEIFATVGSPEKRALIMDRYGIPADHIFHSRDTSFAAGVRAATDGAGVDVVLNSLAGPLLQESLNLVAPFGHFVEIGKRDLESNSFLEMRPFARHISFSAIDLLAYSRQKQAVIHRAMAEIARLLEQGALSPVHPVTTYPLADISQAFRLLQAGKHTGKVVLTVSPTEQVRVLPRGPTAQLRPDASYLLVGGAGGIGRSMAHWLAAHGVRNLIILSRSAATHPAAAALTAELAPTCRVLALSCDVTSPSSLSQALQTCRSTLPPIRGVIQAAMVLRDTVLERMTLSDYHAALAPKTTASWNLHSQLDGSGPLDFFIFLSSMSGVYGNGSQANYGAGNAYEDALAHHRVTHGLPAVALDLGPVKGVGVLATNTEIARRMTRAGHFPVSESQVLRLLESAILNPFARQIVVGLNSSPGKHWDRDSESQLGRDARYIALQARVSSSTSTSTSSTTNGSSGGLAHALSQIRTRAEAETLVTAAIIAKLAEIFLIPVEDIDAGKTPSDYGVDSLVAVELRNMLALQVAAEVSIFSIMQSGSLRELAGEVLGRSGLVDVGGLE